MAEKENVTGLNCPNCGGMVPVPEGQAIVRCPFCEMRSYVRGERGVLRYQVPQKVERQAAISAMLRFFSSNMAIARNLSSQATISESFLVYLPFWTVWGRVAAWAFGQKRVGSGDKARYEPREVRLVQEFTYTMAACDVGEFGVTELNLTNQELRSFNPDELHNAGMVFEPVGSTSEARQSAEQEFNDQIQRKAGLDRVSQLFTRPFRQRFGLVYYPLWVLRYLYRGRSFQVVVDGYTGEVLYGKAPGNTIYRAAVLVLGMALGAFVAIDLTTLILYGLGDSNDFPFWLLLLTIVGGFAIMYTAYRRFRYGEQYEYRVSKGKTPNLMGLNLANPLEMVSDVSSMKDMEEWIKRLR
jgi:hypothetical protein